MISSRPISSHSFNDFVIFNYRHTDMSAGSPYHYLAYMREGYGRIEAAGIELDLVPGDFFYIPLGLPYHSYWKNSGMIRFDSFGFSNFPLFPSHTYPLQRISPSSQTLALTEMLYQNKAPSYRTLGLFHLLLDSVLPSMQTSPVSSQMNAVLQAEQYMAQHPEESMPQVARHCTISESGLYAAFRAVRGYPPVFARQKFLIEKAVALLSSTDLTVDEISLQLGFHSPTYFRRIFLLHTGKRPSDIRKERTI